MAKLSGVEASHKRNQLVVQGFSIVPNVMPKIFAQSTLRLVR